MLPRIERRKGYTSFPTFPITIILNLNLELGLDAFGLNIHRDGPSDHRNGDILFSRSGRHPFIVEFSLYGLLLLHQGIVQVCYIIFVNLVLELEPDVFSLDVVYHVL